MTSPIRVLVADDNRTDRLLLSAIVRREGHEVVQAVDGLDAIEKFTDTQPQLVLLDALMPGLDGFEVARQIKLAAGESFIPIIFLTSLTEADELARCLVAGGDDFLSKPYNKVILRAKMIALDRMRQMHSTVASQRDEIAQHHARLLREQEAAKDIFDGVAHSGCLDANNIRHLISPLAIFNGDVLLAARNPSGNMFVFLGDFTGHGLTASIGAMPLAEIFYGMTQKGFLLAEVLRECNRKLHDILPVGYFCCAAMADFDFTKQTVEIWNGGLPDLYVMSESSNPLLPVPSKHLPLGVVGTVRFDAASQLFRLGRGDRLIMCTDGILEARNDAGEMFGPERMVSILSSTDRTQAFDAVRDAVYAHIGETGREDDLTLVEVAMLDEDALDAPLPAYQASGQVGPVDWSLEYELGPKSLKIFNPLPLLQHVLMEVPSLRSRGGELFTVLSELYNNALDHGVMGLDSRLKGSANGFAEYYRLRAEALEALTEGFVRFKFESYVNDTGGELKIRVRDSGAGFDHAKHLPDRSSTASLQGSRALHGRGVALLQRLCDSVRFFGCGNDVEAVFRW